jgi:hypothetical protein
MRGALVARTMPPDTRRSYSALDTGLIGYVCRTHSPDERGPTITPVHGTWCYCPGFMERDHAWRRIEPTSRDRLERYILRRETTEAATSSQKEASQRK